MEHSYTVIVSKHGRQHFSSRQLLLTSSVLANVNAGTDWYFFFEVQLWPSDKMLAQFSSITGSNTKMTTGFAKPPMIIILALFLCKKGCSYVSGVM